MTSLLRKRLKRIEAEVTAPVTGRRLVAILTEPAEGAEAAEVKRYEKALAQAMRDHPKVIVVSERYRERTEAGEGLVYVPTEIQALIEKLATTPSGERAGDGNDAAWLAGINSVVIGVNPRAAEPNYKPLE